MKTAENIWTNVIAEHLFIKSKGGGSLTPRTHNVLTVEVA